jgi:lipopolysaccharide-induced tumor necrosis factor-alpha factor
MTIRDSNPPMVVGVPITNGVPASTSYAYAVPYVPSAAFNPAASAPAAPTTTTIASYTIPPPVASAPVPATTTTTIYTIPPPVASAPAPTGTMLPGSLGRNSIAVQCPFCSAQTVTRPRNKIDGGTMIAVVIMCFLFWPLFWLPLCMPSCKSTNHYCRHCHRKIAKTNPCTEIYEFFSC